MAEFPECTLHVLGCADSHLYQAQRDIDFQLSNGGVTEEAKGKIRKMVELAEEKIDHITTILEL
jgi:hypothetical protein